MYNINGHALRLMRARILLEARLRRAEIHHVKVIPELTVERFILHGETVTRWQYTD